MSLVKLLASYFELGGVIRDRGTMNGDEIKNKQGAFMREPRNRCSSECEGCRFHHPKEYRRSFAIYICFSTESRVLDLKSNLSTFTLANRKMTPAVGDLSAESLGHFSTPYHINRNQFLFGITRLLLPLTNYNNPWVDYLLEI